MIVDKLLDDSRGGEGLLDAAGDCGLMTSPLNLAYFYGASPPAAAPGAGDASCSASGPSAPGSPSSDSSDFSSASSVSSCGAVESRPRGGSNAERLPVEPHMGVGRQQRGPFQGVRVKNSVKELLLHIRSHKQKASGQAVDNIKTQGVNGEQYTELTNTVSYSGKRKGPDSLSDGPACKRPTLLHSQFLTPPQTPTPVESMEDVHHNESKQDSSASLLQNIINIKNECSPVSLNTVQVSWMSPVVVPQSSPREQCQDFHGGQVFSPPQKYQPFQVGSSPHMVDQAPMYQYSPQNQNVQQLPQHYTHNSSLEYTSYPRNSQSPKYEQNLFDCQGPQFCPNENFASLLSSHGECENVAVPIQTSPSVQQQNDAHLQNFSTMPHSACEALAGHNAASVPLSTSLPFQNIIGNPVNTTQLGKSFFQWQVEQEENKLANISQDQFLSKDADGDTFLHIAVAQGRRALSYVLARKMNALHMLDIKEHNGQSAFQVAVAANQHLIVQDLVNLGAQVNTTDCWGRTPLHVCAEKGHSQVLQAIQKGAVMSNQFVDLEATNYDGLTPLHCAVVAHNAVVHELQRNRQSHSPEVQELLLKNKSLVDTIKCLIGMGAAVEAKDRKSGRTALHLAAEEANLELIRLFLELPSCLSFVNAKAYNGNTALHVAASLQYRVTQLDAVRLLMRKGADPSTRNLENEQPVHLVPDGPVGEQIRRILKGKSIPQRAPPY
ncbi:NF-kappa-B inhibitor zeta isoform X1 [Pteropus medius]|uniref:NF-kappa-B inhibitor zeta n=2 Tax=Pteropus vampyrus TaxID=132908 RepID=A0A6P3S3U2_PTEVA|nr:NF-kappa-B inhibitor zeta isoform X1 [Pteropus vampyrus]XP_039712986.1 NF-kappa-B inhibitor zeta isoform X1 [Pteropus giganteus]